MSFNQPSGSLNSECRLLVGGGQRFDQGAASSSNLASVGSMAAAKAS